MFGYHKFNLNEKKKKKTLNDPNSAFKNQHFTKTSKNKNNCKEKQMVVEIYYYFSC